MIPGTSDYQAGVPNRVSFLVVDKQSQLIERPTAHVWIARGLKQKPFAETTATLEPVGVPGGAKADAQNIYVTTIDTAAPVETVAPVDPSRRPDAVTPPAVAQPAPADVHSSAELMEKFLGTAADAPMCFTCVTKMRPAAARNLSLPVTAPSA